MQSRMMPPLASRSSGSLRPGAVTLLGCRLVLGLGLGVAGCNGPTTLLLDVRMANGEAAPPSLLVSVYDAEGGLDLDHRIRQPPPGRIVIVDLPAREQPIRVVVKGIGAGMLRLGAATLHVHPHRQINATLELSAATIDSDQDTIPDSVDNCPAFANADQLDDGATGTGNACRGDDLAVGPDGAVVDLGTGTPLDFTGVTLDLTGVAPPDLSGAPPVDLHAGPPADLFGLTPDLLAAPATDLRSTDLPPAASCATSTRARCEDFESGAISSARWGLSQTAATVSTVTAATGKVYRGSYAMRVEGAASASGFSGGISDSDLLTPLSSGFYVRAFFYLVGPGIDYAQLGEAGPSAGGTGHLLAHDGRYVTLQDYGYTTPNLYQSSTSRLPLDQWFCLEWQVKRGATQAQGETHVWLNDVELTDLQAVPAPVGATDFLFVGYTTDRTTAATLYVDELIVDGARIGCAE